MQRPAPEAAEHNFDGRDPLALKILRLLDAREYKKSLRDSARDGQRYEREAAERVPGSVSHGQLMLSAGQSYMNARQTERAVTCLEEAEPGIEGYKMQGTQSGFLNLARLYHVLGGAYEITGRSEEQEVVLAKEVAIAGELEKHFGIHTEFGPDDTRVMYRARPQSANSSS